MRLSSTLFNCILKISGDEVASIWPSTEMTIFYLEIASILCTAHSNKIQWKSPAAFGQKDALSSGLRSQRTLLEVVFGCEKPRKWRLKVYGVRAIQGDMKGAHWAGAEKTYLEFIHQVSTQLLLQVGLTVCLFSLSVGTVQLCTEKNNVLGYSSKLTCLVMGFNFYFFLCRADCLCQKTMRETHFE